MNYTENETHIMLPYVPDLLEKVSVVMPCGRRATITVKELLDEYLRLKIIDTYVESIKRELKSTLDSLEINAKNG